MVERLTTVYLPEDEESRLRELWRVMERENIHEGMTLEEIFRTGWMNGVMYHVQHDPLTQFAGFRYQS